MFMCVRKKWFSIGRKCEKPHLPSLFIGYGKSDAGEQVANYFFSWTLRCCARRYRFGANGRIHKYAKRLLAKLVLGDSSLAKTLVVKDLDIKREKTLAKGAMDILVKVETVVSGQRESHVLVIELKVSTKNVTKKQLNKYRSHLKPTSNTKSHFVVIRMEPDSTTEAERVVCDATGYKYLIWNDLVEAMGFSKHTKPTGNALFDEFWFNWEKDAKKQSQEKPTEEGK